MMERFRVIARHAGISMERLDVLLEEADADEVCYDLPEAVLNPAKAFSTTFKRRVLSLIVWSNVLLFAVIPALAGLLALHVNLEGHARWAAYVGGIGLAVFAAIVMNSFLAFAGWPRLKEKLRVNLERDGIDVNAWGGTFVSLAPGGDVRVYDGFMNWDVGFLGFDGDFLCYVGDNARFALRREHIREVRLVSHFPGWIRAERLCITWNDSELDEEGSFYICPGEVRSLLHVTAASRGLEGEVRTWLAGRRDDEACVGALSRLPLPQLDSVTGQPWKAVVNASALFKAAMRQALWAFWVCVLFRLLWSNAAEYGPGLYAVAASVISMVAYHVPYLAWRGGARG